MLKGPITLHRPLAVLERSLRSVVVPLSLNLLLVAPATSQIVLGRALNDSSDIPIKGVTIALLDLASEEQRTVVSNAEGEFAIAITAPGTYRLRASRTAYATTRTPPIEIGAGEVVELELRLADDAVEGEALTVLARRPETQRERDLREFYDRADQYGERHLGSTQIYTRDSLAGWDPFSLQDVFEFHVQWSPASPNCTPRVFLDGRPGHGPYQKVIGPMAVSNFEGLELYAGGGPVRSRFWDPLGCGVILVWTRWLPGDSGGLDVIEVLALAGGAALLILQALGLLF